MRYRVVGEQRGVAVAANAPQFEQMKLMLPVDCRSLRDTLLPKPIVSQIARSLGHYPPHAGVHVGLGSADLEKSDWEGFQ